MVGGMGTNEDEDVNNNSDTESETDDEVAQLIDTPEEIEESKQQ